MAEDAAPCESDEHKPHKPSTVCVSGGDIGVAIDRCEAKYTFMMVRLWHALDVVSYTVSFSALVCRDPVTLGPFAAEA